MEDVEGSSEVHALQGGFGQSVGGLANVQDESKPAHWHQQYLSVAGTLHEEENEKIRDFGEQHGDATESLEAGP